MTTNAPIPGNPLRASEAARIALAAELAAVRREVRELRAIRQHPELEPLVDMLHGETDEAFAANAARFAAALKAAREKMTGVPIG